MIKQYRINHIVEAVQYNGINMDEIEEFLGQPISASLNFSILQGHPDCWVLKNIFGLPIVLPNVLFQQLYTEVNE